MINLIFPVRRIAVAAIAILTVISSSFALEQIAFMGGLSRQSPNGGVDLHTGYALRAAVGVKAVKDLHIMLKFDIPTSFETTSYPAIIGINGADSSFFFKKFTAYDIMIQGHYVLPLFAGSKVHPKVYGGLGMFWMYNTQKSNQMADVNFFGIGPEFGLGMVYEAHKNLRLDFTFAVMMPTYNEYTLSGNPTSSVGVDEQYLSFNIDVFYFIDLP